MKYPKDYLDEIKLRLKVSHVVGKSVKLKKRGKEFIGLSPFSNEKTPSFTVNDEKGFYHCFSSSEHGNIFDFLMKTKNYKFGEAVRTLAAEAGLPPYKFTKHDEEKEKRWNIYKAILEKYSTFCHEELFSGKYSEVAGYLSKRNTLKKEIAFFKIGYSPLQNNFYEKLSEEFSEEQIKLSGIYYLDEKKNKYVDRFRNRIIFPVKSLNGSIFALGGRALSKTVLAKYINSPETEFYKKGNNLYNINSAKECRDKKEEAYIVEGYMDVVSLHKSGIENVVANLGTAMTERQIELIWRFFKNPVICLDGDNSGKKAAERAAERLFPLMKSDSNIYFLELPENMDPDSYINKYGKESFLELSENKVEIQNFVWDSYYKDVDRNNPRSLSLFEKKIKEICYQLKDETLRKYYLDYFNKRLQDLTPSLNIKKGKNFSFKKIESPLQETKKIFNQRIKFSDRILKEYSIIYLIINNLDYFCDKIEIISEIKFSDQNLDNLRNRLISHFIENKKLVKKQINYQDLEPEFEETIKSINKFAPVKMIVKNKKEEDLFYIFNEILDEISEIELNDKITILETKVAKEMDEKLYAELLSLKSHRKSG